MIWGVTCFYCCIHPLSNRETYNIVILRSYFTEKQNQVCFVHYGIIGQFQLCIQMEHVTEILTVLIPLATTAVKGPRGVALMSTYVPQPKLVLAHRARVCNSFLTNLMMMFLYFRLGVYCSTFNLKHIKRNFIQIDMVCFI